MISEEDIKSLASLARIDMSDQELKNLTSDVKNILAYVDQLQEVEVGSLERDTHGKIHTLMREDREPHEVGMFTERLLKSAPSHDGEYVKVKKILP